jgi:glutaredoxin
VRTVVLYTRPGCHLCEEARATLERLRARHPFRLEERDITADDALHRAYVERIPVGVLDGRELFECEVDEQAFVDALVLASRP